MRSAICVAVRYLFLAVYCGWNIRITLQDNQTTVMSHLDSTETANKNQTIVVEALWDETSKNQTQVTVHAGESIIFVCRIWTSSSGVQHISNSETHITEQSVFLFCPMSVAYCAQDCLLVDSKWPFQCTRQFRIISDSNLPWSGDVRYANSARERHLQEVIYKVDIATITSTGSWSCSYGGYHSNTLELTVRDRPALLSLKSIPPSPVETGTNVKLICEAAPSPKAAWYTFIWRRLGSQMPPAHSTLRISDTISILTLLSVQPVDDGVYTCHILQSSSNSVNDEWWDKTEIMKSRVSSPTDKLKFTKDPAMQRLHLDVYHPPTSLNLTVFPRGPYKAGTNITFTCHIHGGKPKPLVHFYRTSTRFDNGNISVINLNSYNPKNVLENITQKAQSTQLSWQLTEADNIVSFGCAAISPVIKDQMFSLFVEVEIIFPPDQPILSAVPHGPVSENRTKVFTCQSSKGSNPRAKILWELTPAMEYITTASKRDYMNYTKPSEKETVIKPVKNSDFEMEISDMHSNIKRDSNNGGYIAFSEVRLIGRPWFNGARVSCHLVWGSEVDYSAVHQNIYHKTVYLSVEVFFCPSAVNLITIPQNGIQEMYGEQILECTATSSHPPAVLIWFYHNSSGSVQKTTTENVIMEDSLMKVDAQPMSNLIITTETFPGIYGGKRVVSRLKLHNISRNYDGMLYVCVVKHIEWTESISRAYQLTVLYPPELKVTIMPQTWQERLKSSQTTLVCTVEGGQPRYFEGENEVLNMAGYGNMISGNNGSIFALNHALHDDKHSTWKFYWKFRPNYPDNWMQNRNQEVLVNNLNNSNKLILEHPGRKEAGEYTCLLEGPAGIAQVTRHLEFAFPPELAPPRITLVTAAIGSQTVIELHIWAYPIPSSIYNLKGSKMKHRFVKHCNLQEIDPQILNEVNTQKKVYTWYKVTTKRTPSEIRILQKELIHENWIPLDREKQIYHNFNKQQRIWTDAILIELPYYETDEQINKNVSQNKKGLLRKIPTIIYRLFLSPLAENDYGEYLCEVEHETGRKQFFIQVQPPGNPPISVKNIRFIREQSYIRVYFDPLNFLRSIKGVTSHIDDSKNHILMTKSTVHVNKVRSLLSSSADDKKQQLEWKMVMVICPLYYSQRNKLSEHADNDCSSPHIKNSIQRKFNYDQWLEVYRLLPNIKYQTTLLSNECIEKLIEYPEQGRIEILLAYPYNHTVKNTSYREAETNFNETTKQSNLFVDKALPNDDQGIQVNWSNDEKLTYQFRFYDEVGSLTYSTEWYYEENDNYIEESAFSQFIHRKTYMWIIIAGVSIFPLLTILLILVLRKKLSIKKDFDTNFNQSLTPLNKSMINSAATSPIANCKLQDNFYVANFSVVDSPCSLISRNERLNSRQFSKISSMCNREVQKFPNDKYQSDNRHISNQNLHYNTLQKGEMINGENESINMPKNLFELRYNQLSLSHNQCSGEGLNDEIHSISPVTYSPIVSHFSPVPLIRSNEIIPSSSLLLYNTCCHNRKLGIEMNYSFPPLFGPMPILRNSQSPNTSSELSSPILGDGNKFRGRLPTSTNFCYHQHVQKLNNSKQNKRKPQEDTISQIATDNKMNQSRVKQTTDDKNIVNTEKNLNCNNQATETLMNQTGNKYHVSQTDSCDGCKSFHQPNHSSLLLKNNLYATNRSNFEVCVVDTDGANNTNIRNDNNQDDLGQFDANHDFINNNPQDITNNSDHCSMNYRLDNHNLSRMVYPSESDHLSSPLINNRQNSLIRNNQSSGLKGNLKMNKVDVNDIHYNTDQYLKKLNDVKMSTFNQNHSLFDRLSPYDNTTISSLTGNYNTPLANQVNIHSVEMYANKNLSNDSHFSGLTEKTNNDKKSCTINSVTTDNL